MEKIAQTEEELIIVTWWKNLDKQNKNSISTLEYGCKKSYKKLNYNQVRLLYKRWT